MQKFLNTLCEFTGEKKDKDNFIQKALKVCKVFKVKPLKTPKPDVPSKKTAYNLFCREIWKTKKELQSVPVSKASGIISKEWKKVKASEKKMKKYRDLYEEEKQRHEKTLQIYQEDHTDEMKIINLHKKCNKKARKVSQPKTLSKSHEPKKAPSKSDEPKKALSKSDEPKKVSEPIDDPSEEEQKPKKSDGKKTATKAGKKVKKASQTKKVPKWPKFIDSSEESEEEEEGLPQDDKEEKIPPLLGVKEEFQSFFGLQKESKKKKKDLIKQALAKT